MEQSAELRDLTLRLFEAWTSGEFSFFERYLSQQDGVLVIGSDPDEWWDDYDTIAKVTSTQIEEMAGVSIVDNDPQAYSEGTVGWVSDHPTFQFPDGTKVPFRTTLVFHQEGGEWKLAQMHHSIGVPNEAAIGQELTT
jgi:hypothetical protein